MMLLAKCRYLGRCTWHCVWMLLQDVLDAWDDAVQALKTQQVQELAGQSLVLWHDCIKTPESLFKLLGLLQYLQPFKLS